MNSLNDGLLVETKAFSAPSSVDAIF